MKKSYHQIIFEYFPPSLPYKLTLFKEFIQKDNELFSEELNPPAIIIEPQEERTAPLPQPTTPILAPVARSLNPFQNIKEHIKEVDGDDGDEDEEREMLVDDKDVSGLLPVVQQQVETNPFRRLSGDEKSG